MNTNILETLKATFANREEILDLNVIGNYAKIAAGLIIFLCLLNVEHTVNMLPLMRSLFTLVGLGVVIRHCARKEDRTATLNWVKVQAEKFF